MRVELKKMYISLTIIGLILLVGCTEDKTETEFIEIGKIENTEENVVLEIGNNENYKIPFEITEINSVIVKLNDPASEGPLKGVQYDVSLFSNEQIPDEDIASYEFEIVANSPLIEMIGPIQPLRLADTREGIIYSLSFGTVFNNYSSKELGKLNNERDFQIFLNYKGVRYLVAFQ